MSNENNLSIYNESTDIYKSRTYINKILEAEFDSTKEYTVCGRVLSIRKHSTVTFMLLRDASEAIQVAIFKTSKPQCDDLDSIIVGTFILVKGTTFISSSDQRCIASSFIQVLTIPKRGFTKQHFGSSNKIMHSIVDDNFATVFSNRSKIFYLIRQFMALHAFQEAETPVLQAVPSGGDNIHTFDTMHNAFQKRMYLRVAPECFLKRMIIAGWEKVFELARCFRNEGISYKHNPEFTLLEAYAAYTGLDDMMNIVEELIEFLATKLNVEEKISIKRISFLDKLSEYLKQDCMTISIEALQKITASTCDVRITLLEDIFENHISDYIKEPTFVYHLPSFSAPLARFCTHNIDLAERAELYIEGMEICNLCVELRDADLQRKLIENTLGDDKDFLDDLELGMPPLTGFGIGVDRLVMFLLKSRTVRENMLFS